MIDFYKIKVLDNEEILCLYLNYSYEFGDFFNTNNINDLKEKVKNFIANMKINFKGTKILLVIGGVSLATIFLSPSDIKDIDDLSMKYTSSSIVEKVFNSNTNTKDTFVTEDENKKIEETVTLEKEEKNEINSVTNTQKTTQNDKNSEEKSNVETVTETVEIPTKEVVTSTNNQQENNNVEIEKPKEETIVKENLVTIYRSNDTILELPFEEYIVGVVAAEMPASFPEEALKAQAVVARTYANNRLSKGLTLTDSVSTQVYKDENELRKMWGSSYDYYYSKVKNAVESTKGLSIYYNGNYIDAVYHSTSNGYTEDAEYVWGNSIPYLKSVSSPWDTSATPYFKVEEKSNEVLLNTLGFSISNDTVIEIVSRDTSGRVTEVRIGDSTYDGVTLRTMLGLRSADFDLEVKDGNLVVTTRGYGHGVGMSQYGASGMAKAGYSFIDILKHYYTGVSIY